MRTEYKVWHWATDDSAGEIHGQYATIEAAMLATGYPLPVSWIDAPGGGGFILQRAHLFQSGRVRTPWLIDLVRIPETAEERIELALAVALEFGQIDGSHHKDWVIDQMVRHLTGDRYKQLIAEYCDGEDGPETYSWDEGVAP